ncbi:MAG: hypothetical protein HGA87_01715 [Desulfobulbaceae bacterium]|nr:hypothetical protein [Desulfobulbaceae bacterium]
MPIPIITRANQSVEAQTPASVQFSTGTGRALEYLGDTLSGIASDIRQKAREKYAADVDVTLKQEMSRIERENLGNPEGMISAFQTFRDGYVSQIDGQEMKDFASRTFDLGVISPINRAYGAQRARMDNEATQSLMLQVEANQNTIAQNIDDLFSGDEALQRAAWSSIAQSSEKIYRASSVTGADGTPLISGIAGANLVSDTKDKIMTGIAMKWLSGQTDAYSALQQMQEGKVVYEAKEGDKPYPINIMNSMSLEARRQVLSQAEQFVTQQESMRKKAVADVVAMASLGISRGEIGYQDLEKMRPQLDPEQYARLSKELDKANEKNVASAQNYGTIADAMAGKQPVMDLADPQMKKDINSYYETVVVPGIQDKPTNVQINATVDYVKKVGVIPQQLLGTMKSAFRTGDAKTIRYYADVLAQLKESAPQAFRDIPQSDIAFGEVVADMVNAGEPPAEAVKIAKELVNPANKAVMENRVEALKSRNRDTYLKEIKGVFDSWVPFVGVKIDPNNAAGAAVVADYKTQYDNYFKLTGNESVARQHAVSVVKGMYGVTEFNGKQVIAHPPEKYYSIQGLDNQNWMIQQLMDDVRALGTVAGKPLPAIRPDFETPQAAAGYRVLKNIETIGKAVIPHGDPLESRLFLVSDNTTDRMAASGKPTYVVMYKNDIGALLPVMNKAGRALRWAPVSEKGKQKAIDEAKKKQARKQATADAILGAEFKGN